MVVGGFRNPMDSRNHMDSKDRMRHDKREIMDTASSSSYVPCSLVEQASDIHGIVHGVIPGRSASNSSRSASSSSGPEKNDKAEKASVCILSTGKLTLCTTSVAYADTANRTIAALDSFEIEEHFDVVAWLPCGNFLFAGNSQGFLHCLHANTNREVWKQYLPEASKSGFLDLKCYFSDGDGITNANVGSGTNLVAARGGAGESHTVRRMTLLILLKTEVMIVLDNFELSSLHDALETGDCDKARQSVLALKEDILRTVVSVPNARQLAYSTEGVYVLTSSKVLIFSPRRMGLTLENTISIRAEPILLLAQTFLMDACLVVVCTDSVEIYDPGTRILISRWKVEGSIIDASRHDASDGEPGLVLITRDNHDRYTVTIRQFGNGEIWHRIDSNAFGSSSGNRFSPVLSSGGFLADNETVYFLAENNRVVTSNTAAEESENLSIETLLQGPDITTESLPKFRRGLECIVEKSIQGTLVLKAEMVIAVVRKLGSQSAKASFVANQILRCVLPTLKETKQVLAGTLDVLNTLIGPQSRHEAKRGLLLLTEALSRLATFEQLTGFRQALGVLFNKQRNGVQRASLSGRGNPGLCVGAAKLKEVGKLMGKNKASEPAWDAGIWHKFRLTSLPQLCIELAQAERIHDMIAVFGRHGAKFDQRDILSVLEAMPAVLSADEDQIPRWVGNQVLPLLVQTKRLDVRARLVRWLCIRAQNLEPQLGCDVALKLLNSVLFSPTYIMFPEAIVRRGGLWAGVRQMIRPTNEREAKLRQLFLDLDEIVYLRDRHQLECSLKDFDMGGDEDDDVPGNGSKGSTVKGKGKIGSATNRAKNNNNVNTAQSLRQPEMVVCRLLNRVGASGLLMDEITHHVIPYCKRHELAMDAVLKTYITILIQEEMNEPKQQKKAKSKERNNRKMDRCIEVLKAMQDVNIKAESLLVILQLHCELGPELQTVVDEAKAWEISGEMKDKIETQVTLLGSSEVLRRHGLSEKVLSDPSYGHRCVHYLINLVQVPHSLNDALVLLSVSPRSLLSPLDARILRVISICSSTSLTDDIKARDLKNVLTNAGAQSAEVCDGLVDFACKFMKDTCEESSLAVLYGFGESAQRNSDVMRVSNVSESHQPPESKQFDDDDDFVMRGIGEGQMQIGGSSSSTSRYPGSPDHFGNQNGFGTPPNSAFSLTEEEKIQCQQHCALAIEGIQHVFSVNKWPQRRRFSQTGVAMPSPPPSPGAYAASGCPVGSIEGTYSDNANLHRNTTAVPSQHFGAYAGGGNVGANNSDYNSRSWCCSSMLDALQRLSKLQKDFDIYVDPLALLSNTRTMDQEDEVRQVFERNAIDKIQLFLHNKSSRRSTVFTRLLHLADLLGLGRTYVWQVIVREASTRGMISSLKLTMELVPKDHTLRETSGELLALVRNVLAEFSLSHFQNSRHPAALIFHLAHLLDLVVYCLDWCASEYIEDDSLTGAERSSGGSSTTNMGTNSGNITPLVNLASDLHFCLDVLLTSDLLDIDREILKEAPLKHLSVSHAQIIRSLFEGRNDENSVLYSSNYREVPSLLPGKEAVALVLDFLNNSDLIFPNSGDPLVTDGNGDANETGLGRRTSNSSLTKIRNNRMEKSRMEKSTLGNDKKSGSSIRLSKNAENRRLPSSHKRAPLRSGLQDVYDLLKDCRCLLLAKRVLARGMCLPLEQTSRLSVAMDTSPRLTGLHGDDMHSNSHLYQELCQEAALNVIFGNNLQMDHLLFLGYMACLSADVCRDVYQQAVAYIEKECGGWAKMQDLSSLGRILGYLLKKDDLRTKMDKAEKHWKWNTRLQRKVELSIDLMSRSDDLALIEDLVRPIIHNFPLSVVLEFAQDFNLKRNEVIELWVEIILLHPVVPPNIEIKSWHEIEKEQLSNVNSGDHSWDGNPRDRIGGVSAIGNMGTTTIGSRDISTIGSASSSYTMHLSSEGEEIYLQLFDNSYQHRIPAQLHLIDGSRVLQTVLEQVSPYDYERIKFVLRFLSKEEGNSNAAIAREANTLERIVEVLQRYRRISRPTDTEIQAIQKWRCDLALPPKVEDLVLQLADSRLPCHSLLNADDRWLVLRPELDGGRASKLTALTTFLNIPNDELYVEIGNDLLARGRTDGIMEYLEAIQDAEKAKTLAAEVQTKMTLSKELVEVATFRAARSADDVAQLSAELEREGCAASMTKRERLRQLKEEKSALSREAKSLKSQLDLKEWGWEMTTNVFLNLGVVPWICCVYYWLAPKICQRMKLSVFHSRVKQICHRHGLDFTRERKAILGTWLKDISWTPQKMLALKDNVAGQVHIDELERHMTSGSLLEGITDEIESGAASSINAISNKTLNGMISSQGTPKLQATPGLHATPGGVTPKLVGITPKPIGMSSGMGASGGISGMIESAYKRNNPGKDAASGHGENALWGQSELELEMIDRIALVAAPGMADDSEIFGGKVSATASGDAGDSSSSTSNPNGVTSATSSSLPSRGSPSSTERCSERKQPYLLSPERTTSVIKEPSSAMSNVSTDTAGENRDIIFPGLDAEGSSQLRSMIKMCLHWLLRENQSHAAANRAFCILFRIATLSEIATVYKHPIEELFNVWKGSLYMESLESTQSWDYTKFATAQKEGLARAYWRAHQNCPRTLSVLLGIIVDYGVCDPKFVSQVLMRLADLRMWDFLLAALLHIHQTGFLMDLVGDRELADVLQRIMLDIPLRNVGALNNRSGMTRNTAAAAVGNLLNSTNNDTSSPGYWVKCGAISGMIGRSPFISYFDIMTPVLRALRDLERGNNTMRSNNTQGFGHGMHGMNNIGVSTLSKREQIEKMTKSITLEVLRIGFATVDQKEIEEELVPTVIEQYPHVIPHVLIAANKVILDIPKEVEEDLSVPMDGEVISQFTSRGRNGRGILTEVPQTRRLSLFANQSSGKHFELSHVNDKLFVAALKWKELLPCLKATLSSSLFDSFSIIAVQQMNIRELLLALITDDRFEDGLDIVIYFTEYHQILHLWDITDKSSRSGKDNVLLRRRDSGCGLSLMPREDSGKENSSKDSENIGGSGTPAPSLGGSGGNPKLMRRGSDIHRRGSDIQRRNSDIHRQAKKNDESCAAYVYLQDVLRSFERLSNRERHFAQLCRVDDDF